MRLIHLTDPHLSSLDEQRFIELRGKRRSGYLSWYKNRRHVHRPEILDIITSCIESESPDQILLTGDLIHIGLESEIVQAAQWLRALGPPGKVMLIPGNHDNYAGDSLATMRHHWRDYLPDPGEADADYAAGYPVLRKIERLHIIGLNSSCTTRIFSAAGELGDEQRSRLNGLLNEGLTDGAFQCVLIHHPPFPKMTKRRKALRDNRQLEELLSVQPPELMLYGHLHRDREHVAGETHIYCTASASSAHGASYRVFDIDRLDGGWSCHMRLMTLPADSASSGNKPVIKAQSSWSVRK